MKGLETVPSRVDLIRFYEIAEGGPLSPLGLCHLACVARFDPRLAEILVGRLAKAWRLIDPVATNEAVRLSPWPAALGVLAEHAACLMPSKERREFRRWKAAALFGACPADGELFWIGAFQFAGQAAQREADESVKPYRRWGYFGRDWLVNKASSRTPSVTIVPRPERLRILRCLAIEREMTGASFFRLKDYLAALDHRVRPRTAETDLARADFLRRRGERGARVYRLRPCKIEKLSAEKLHD